MRRRRCMYTQRRSAHPALTSCGRLHPTLGSRAGSESCPWTTFMRVSWTRAYQGEPIYFYIARHTNGSSTRLLHTTGIRLKKCGEVSNIIRMSMTTTKLWLPSLEIRDTVSVIFTNFVRRTFTRIGKCSSLIHCRKWYTCLSYPTKIYGEGSVLLPMSCPLSHR